MKIIHIVILSLLVSLRVAEGSELDLESFVSNQCGKNIDQYNFISVKTIDLNGDGTSEYIALHQGNNFTEHYYYSLEACGYSAIKNGSGTPLTSLSSSGSFSCAPHGCFAVVQCSLGTYSNHISVLELSSTEHSAALMSDQTPPSYDYSSKLTETMYFYSNGFVDVLWQETKSYTEKAISKLQSSERFRGCE